VHYAKSNYDAGEGDDPTLALNAVQVMTLHGTKGLGFPVVFMPYSVHKDPKELGTGFLDPRKFDFSRYKGGEVDERRLFYVGMTRAQRFLVLSYPQIVKKTRQEISFPLLQRSPGYSVFNFCFRQAGKEETVPAAGLRRGSISHKLQ